MQIDETDIIYIIVYNSWTTLLFNRYFYIDIDYCMFLSIDYIDIYSDMLY